MITKDDFAAQAGHGAAMLLDLPVTTALLRFLTGELKKGDPPWWKKTAQAWEKRRFVYWSEAWSLFLTALHFEALSDEQNPLAAYFPTCGGTADADPAPALAKFLASAPNSFYEHLKTGQRRYHTKSTAGVWRMAAASFFQARGLPYYLVEVNSGAGLNLAADVIYRDAPAFDSKLVAARIGLDPFPLSIEDIDDCRWLAGTNFPDMLPAVTELGEVVEKLKKQQKKDPNFVQLVKCNPELACKFIAKNIRATDQDVGLLIFNVMTTGRMTDQEYAEFTKGIWETLGAWGDRAAWFEAETVRGELCSTTIKFRVSRRVNNELRTFDMGWVDHGAKKHSFDPEGAKKFLAVAEAS